MADKQRSIFDDAVDVFPNLGRPLMPALDSASDLPPGPYSVGMTIDASTGALCPPFLVRGGDGRCVAGHVASRMIADKLAAALNLAYPAVTT